MTEETTDDVIREVDDLHERPRAQVEEAARRWFTTACDMKSIQDQLIQDLETALNACRDYQRILSMLESPDLNFVTVRKLLTKYHMTWEEPAESARIYDITIHPDSVDSTADDLVLEERIERVELVRDDETGKFHLVPIASAVKYDTSIDLEDAEVEDVGPESREWLTHSIEKEEAEHQAEADVR